MSGLQFLSPRAPIPAQVGHLAPGQAQEWDLGSLPEAVGGVHLVLAIIPGLGW